VKRYGYLLLLLLPLLLMAGAPALAGALLPDIPEAIKGKQCVEDTEFMRRNHMDLLKHQREDTVRRGFRTKKHSLKNCFTCHVVKGADGKPVTVSDPRHFCRECHDYAAVKPDCWQCHVSTPEAKEGEL
jgi:predicted CXXCH cytochrome family protein